MIKEYIDQLQKENREKLNAYDREMKELTQDLTDHERLLSNLQAKKQDDKNIFSPRSVNSGADEEIRRTMEEIDRLKQRMEYVRQMLESEVRNRDEYEKLAEEAAKEDARAKAVKEEESVGEAEAGARAEETKEDTHAREAEPGKHVKEVRDDASAGEAETEACTEAAVTEAHMKATKEDARAKAIKDDASAGEAEPGAHVKAGQEDAPAKATKKDTSAEKEEPGAHAEKVEPKTRTDQEKEPKDAGPENEVGKSTQELIDFLDSVYKKIQFSASLVNGNKNRCRSELRNVERMIKTYKENLQKPKNDPECFT